MRDVNKCKATNEQLAHDAMVIGLSVGGGVLFIIIVIGVYCWKGE